MIGLFNMSMLISFFFLILGKYYEMKLTGNKYKVLDLKINCLQQDKGYCEQFIRCESTVWCVPQNSKCAIIPGMKEVMVLFHPATAQRTMLRSGSQTC